jgi:hypothetical protein
MNKRVLFLDFDGVLLPFGMKAPDNDPDWVSPRHVAHLNDVVAATDCDIVISSDWRKFDPLDRLVSFLVWSGFDFPDKVVDVTDDNRVFVDDVDRDGNFDRRCVATNPRGTVIRKWITDNGCDNFVIVDDNEVGDGMDGWLVQTDPTVGLTHDVAQTLIKRLLA